MIRGAAPLWEAAAQALRTMRAQKLRTFFALAGVFIGVTFLVAVVSIVEGLNRFMIDRFANVLVGANTFELRMQPTLTFTVGENNADAWRRWLRRPAITSSDAEYVATHLRSRAVLSKECRGTASFRFGRRTADGVEVHAVDEAYFTIRHYDIAAGRAFGAVDVRAGLPVLVLGADVAEKLLAGVDPIDKAILVNGIPYRVVGVLAKQGTFFGMSLDRFAVVPFTAGQRITCTADAINALIVRGADSARMKAAMIETEALMRGRRRLRPAEPNNFTFQTSDDVLESWHKISRILGIALPALVSISLVVGGIVIMNIMLAIVTERTREIEVRKALGATRGEIRLQFLTEAATITLAGCIAGLLAGALIAWGIRTFSPIPATIPLTSVLAALAAAIFTGVLFGAYPARRAARLDPIEALRHE